MAQANTRSSSKDKPSSSSSNGSKESISGSGRSKASESGNASDNKPARSAAKAVAAGVATGAAGLVAGAVLGTRLGKKPKRVLGVRVPGSGRGLDDVVKEVGRAGEQFKRASRQVGQLTSEVQAAREKAEQIGRVIT